MDEENLIEELKRGNTFYLNEFIEGYGKLVYGVIKSVLNNSHEESFIDQCFNDVILTIWYNVSKYDGKRGNFKSFIISITKYKAIDFKRSTNKMYRNEELSEEIVDSSDILEEIILRENREELIRAIDSLEEIDREVFRLRFLKDKNVDEVSRELGLTKSNIYTRISRGKTKLKRIMEG